jgi:hypothetical protein
MMHRGNDVCSDMLYSVVDTDSKTRIPVGKSKVLEAVRGASDAL